MFATRSVTVSTYAVVGKPLIAGVVRGFHGACIAYGQSGAGKTYTMLGPQGLGQPGSDAEGGEAAQGLMPRMLRHLFQVRNHTASASRNLISLRDTQEIFLNIRNSLSRWEPLHTALCSPGLSSRELLS